MYHDQVLAPFKTLYKFNAINLTLGLKYLRASQTMELQKILSLKKKLITLAYLKCIKTLIKLG